MDLFPIERIGQGRDLMDSGEGANGGPYASLGGRSFLGHKKRESEPCPILNQ